jgi:hypothetical protein
MVNTGLSEVMGSWKTIPISPPRMSRIVASSAAGDVEHRPVRPGEADRARGDPPAAEFDKPHQRQRGDGLARAGFAHDADGLARARSRSSRPRPR